MLKNEDLHKEYKTFMLYLVHKGCAEPVPKNQIDRNNETVWYIPQYGMYHPRKDLCCGVSYRGKSLNK